LPHLAKLEEQFGGEGVVLVALLSDRRTPAVESFANEVGIVPYLVTDETHTSTSAYGVNGVPTTVIIDETGRLMYRHLGFDEGMEEQFEEEILRLLAWKSET
jgi:hypothetical protein